MKFSKKKFSIWKLPKNRTLQKRDEIFKGEMWRIKIFKIENATIIKNRNLKSKIERFEDK